jgi:hypothetical protein
MTAARELDVRLATPGDWVVLRRDDLASEEDVDRFVGDRLDAVPELAPYRDELVTSVARTRARAERDGVVFTALLADIAPQGIPVLANLVVATSAAPSPELAQAAVPAEDAAAPGVQDVERALDEAAPPEQGVTQRVVHSMLLPGGPALRVARVAQLALVEGGPEVTVLSVEYFFSPSDLDQVFVVRFVSPSIAAHEELQLLFHEIAATFSVSPS